MVTRCELFAGREAPERLRRLSAALIEVPVDTAIAELAGTTRRSTGITTPDALIAATALPHRVPLMTCNRRSFEQVPQLRLVAPA